MCIDVSDQQPTRGLATGLSPRKKAKDEFKAIKAYLSESRSKDEDKWANELDKQNDYFRKLKRKPDKKFEDIHLHTLDASEDNMQAWKALTHVFISLGHFGEYLRSRHDSV